MERSDRTDKRDRFPQAGNTGKHKLWKLRFPDQSVESRCLRTDVSRTCDAIEKELRGVEDRRTTSDNCHRPGFRQGCHFLVQDDRCRAGCVGKQKRGGRRHHPQTGENSFLRDFSEQCRQQDTDRLQRRPGQGVSVLCHCNGAASTGKKVTMFFTFWGLNVIKKQHKPTVTKDIFGKMFGWMLPTHSGKLKLSKMNMGGAGSWMMRLIMKRKRIDSLESLIQQAIDNGVEMICLHHEHGCHGRAKRRTDGQCYTGRRGFLSRTGRRGECKSVHLIWYNSLSTKTPMF